MLNLVGLGLYSLDDLSLGGLKALKTSDKVCLESYTSFHSAKLDELSELTGKKVTVLDRSGVEEDVVENIIEPAKTMTVALIVYGDPLVATTHSGIIIEARKAGVEVRVFHASSIISAVGETGLQVYKFGRIATLNIPEKGYAPTSAYELIKANNDAGLHSLILLDVKADQGRYMSVSEGINELLRLEKEVQGGLFSDDAMLLGLARLGVEDSLIRYGKITDLSKIDFGGPPHAIVLPGNLHFTEEDFLENLR